jgi:glycerate kinase
MVSARLRVLVAPDSFKGSLTSVEVADAIAAGWSRARTDDKVDRCPMADGGEGTVAAMVAATGGRLCPARVAGPLGEPVTASPVSNVKLLSQSTQAAQTSSS